MDFNKKAIVTGIALVTGSFGVINTASAVSVSETTFTFQNNTAATQPGLTQAGFAAGSEFHIATPYGSALNDGDKDVIHGGEQWIFDGHTSGAVMTGVANTDTNVGHSGTSGGAFLTEGVAGFPVAPAAGTVPTLHQNSSFVGPTYSVLAPLAGNIVGQTFGAAFIDTGSTNDFSQAGLFTITMPVVYIQWADGGYILGGDGDGDGSGQHNLLPCSPNGPCPGPGVVFNGVTDGVGNFSLWSSHQATRDESTILGYSRNFEEWSLQGTYQIAIADVPLPAAAWLFGSGLVGLVGVARRRRNKRTRDCSEGLQGNRFI